MFLSGKTIQTLLLLTIPAAMLVTVLAIISAVPIVGNKTLSVAITVDLLLTVPFVYWLVIRKTNIPNFTAIPVMIFGLILGLNFMPEGSRYYLNEFKTWVLPFVEIGILTYVVLKVRGVIREFRKVQQGNPDFYSSLKQVTAQMVPGKLNIPFTTEIAMIYYSIFRWKRHTPDKNEFTHHKKSGTVVLLYAFLVVIFIETFALHFLLELWSSTAAWIMTGLSLYTALQVFGITKSLSQRPYKITNSTLYLKYGIASEVEIPLENIEEIELTRKGFDKQKNDIKLSILGDLESHNVVLKLKETNFLTRLYGSKKPFEKIAFFVDDPEKFADCLKQKLTFENPIK